MESHKLGKDLVFYNAGKPGALFTYKSGNLINDEIMNKTLDNLNYDSKMDVKWVEERRTQPRH